MNSKRKGNRFERSVSKWFSDWSGYKFERNRAGSGAWHSNIDAGADITCTDEKHAHRCKLSIECKSYKDIKFEHTLLGNKGSEIEKFWDQALRDADRTKKVPILVMRYNSMPRNEFFIVLDSDVAVNLLSTYPKLRYTRYMFMNIPGKTLYIFMSSKIRDLVDYKYLHKLVKNLLK